MTRLFYSWSYFLLGALFSVIVVLFGTLSRFYCEVTSSTLVCVLLMHVFCLLYFGVLMNICTLGWFGLPGQLSNGSLLFSYSQ